MYNAITSADICSAVVLATLLISYIGTGTVLSKRDRCFFGTCATMLLGCMADAVSYISVFPDTHNHLRLFILVATAFAYVSEYLTSMFFIAYLMAIANVSYRRGFRLIKDISYIFCTAACAFAFVSILLSLASDDTSSFSIALSVHFVLEIIMICLLALVLVLIWPHVSLKYLLAAASTPFGVVIMVPILAVFPNADIGFPIGCLTLIIIHLAIQTDESSRYYKTIDSLTNVYNSLHLINISDNKLVELSANDRIHDLVRDKTSQSIQEQLWSIMNAVVYQSYREMLHDFTNLSTLEKRLEGKTKIHVEAISDKGEWWSFGFVRIGKANKPLNEVLFTSENIDESKRHVETLLWMSHTDRLTGLYNNYAYSENVKKFNDEGLGDDTWYIMIDLNGLKKINDTMGHHTGNEVITGIGTILSLSVQDEGKVFRLGGDEFAILLRATPETIDSILTSIQKNTDDWNQKHTPQISYSIGVVSSDEVQTSSVEELARIADERMYEMKKKFGGR